MTRDWITSNQSQINENHKLVEELEMKINQLENEKEHFKINFENLQNEYQKSQKQIKDCNINASGKSYQ